MSRRTVELLTAIDGQKRKDVPPVQPAPRPEDRSERLRGHV
jgi:hypothetical protein